MNRASDEVRGPWHGLGMLKVIAGAPLPKKFRSGQENECWREVVDLAEGVEVQDREYLLIGMAHSHHYRL